jgi:hypothetical protein
MKPGIDIRQMLALIAILSRSPILGAHFISRIVCRGLVFLADNPDLAWARHLLTGGGPQIVPDTLVLIMDKGKPIFSLLSGRNLFGNLSSADLKSLADMDSFREGIEDDLKRPLQAVRIDAAIIERIKAKVVDEKELDPFFVAGREILALLSEGGIRFSPLIMEAEVGASLSGEELLRKFGPRFGLSIKNPVRFSRVMQGLYILLSAPLKRMRMRRTIAATSD